MDQELLFKSNEKLIYKRSWYYSRIYDIDFEDIKSQAFLIFCETLRRFDEEKSSFTTFLFHRLRTLNDFCRKEKKIANKSVVEENSLDNITVELDSINEQILFEQALDSLSDDGKQVVKKLLAGEFEKPEAGRQRTIGKYRLKQVLTKQKGWTQLKVEDVWCELKSWWKEFETVYNN